MKKVLMTASVLALGTSAAVAGGVERSAQSVGILFEEGTYAELSFGHVDPTVEGTFALSGTPSGDMASSYVTYSLGIKQSLNDNLDLAIIMDQPIGANVSYPTTAVGYPFAGSTATVTSTAVTGLLRYKMPSNFSVYGGLRAESVTGEVSIPVFGGYTMSTARDTQVGYVVGASWEKPEIAARVALTYNSAITHTLDSTEFGAIPGQFDTTVPQSVNLEFQTGIAKDTLLFGSVRWVDWSEFDITPTTFTTAVVPGESLVDYDEDTITYNLGIGRRFNENWSGAITVGYEAAGGGTVGNLGPTDGFTSVGVGATYTKGNMKITGGVRYVEIGDALTVIGPSNGVFSGNSAIGAGVKIGFTF